MTPFIQPDDIAFGQMCDWETMNHWRVQPGQDRGRDDLLADNGDTAVRAVTIPLLAKLNAGRPACFR